MTKFNKFINNLNLQGQNRMAKKYPYKLYTHGLISYSCVALYAIQYSLINHRCIAL